MKEQLSLAEIERFAQIASGRLEIEEAMEIIIKSEDIKSTKDCGTGTCD